MSGGGTQPAFLVTVDTEGDNSWASGQEITTRNAAYLPRFQTLCEKYGLKPTWLTNYEMATEPAFVEFAEDVIRRNTGEVGMHLHAWHSPPEYRLSADDYRFKPFLTEYPAPVMREKIARMTDLLRGMFGERIQSHRAGRWALNETYAQILAEHGYRVDCSVTPHVSWRSTKGDPGGGGGADYRGFPTAAYFLDLNDIRRQGSSQLLEVPVTIVLKKRLLRRGIPSAVADLPGVRRTLRRLAPACWLRPDGRRTAEDLVWVAERSLGRGEGSDYVEFMLHSSELMPGGSPTFRDKDSIERLYDVLEALFSWAVGRFVGMTLAEYRFRYPAPMRS